MSNRSEQWERCRQTEFAVTAATSGLIGCPDAEEFSARLNLAYGAHDMYVKALREADVALGEVIERERERWQAEHAGKCEEGA